MQIQDLFSGAWVKDGGIPAQVTGLTCDGNLETTAYRCTNIEQVGPILLTPEILVKIGLEQDKDEFYLDIEHQWYIHFWNFKLTIWKDYSTYEYEDSKTVFEHTILVLNELQNLFNILGIDKEIRLDSF